MKLVLATEQNFTAFLAARVIFVTVLLGLALLYRDGSSGPGTYLGLIAANIVISLACSELHRRKFMVKGVRWVALSAAVVVDTYVLLFTGGSNSEFVFLYFFSVGAAGLLTGASAGLWAALLATAGLTWLDWTESGSFLSVNVLRLFGYAANFTLTAVLTSFVYGRYVQREQRHRETLGELEQTRLDTQSIIDSLTTGLAVIDKASHLLYSNPAGRAILGLNSDCSDDDVERKLNQQSELTDATRQLLSSGDDRREMVVATSDGPRPVGFSVSAILSRSGEFRGHIVLFNDLTKIKEVERQDRERERLAAVGRLSRDLAHEIRNPLATVRGCIEMLSTPAHAEAGQVKFLELALKESDRLNGILSDFLTFARLETPRKRRGDLREAIRRTVDESPVTVPISERLRNPIEAEFDSDQISLVIDTLLLALAEWGENRGEIRIESPHQSQPIVRIGLPDCALSAEVIEQAFRPFSRVQRKSNGLALPTAMRVIHAHGGALVLESLPESGTYFEISL